jgi:adenylylsulfate kinase-like enzyme
VQIVPDQISHEPGSNAGRFDLQLLHKSECMPSNSVSFQQIDYKVAHRVNLTSLLHDRNHRVNDIHNPAIISMNECAILVTGLPASGKTTLGRRLAAALSWPYLDKDDFLEALFESQGVGDEQWRRRLSIEADKQFETTALEQTNTVLVSHWRPRGRADTGTPTDWVNRRFHCTVEVYCECDPELAARRFVSRTRHPGHLDKTKPEEAVLSWMHDMAALYPLSSAKVIRVSSISDISIHDVVDEIRQLGL